MTQRIRFGVGLGLVAALGFVLWTMFPPPVPGDERGVLIDEIAATREALAAWAEFASSGDLSTVHGFFDPDGPQYRQLAAEAAAAREWDGDQYDFTLADAEVVAPGLVTGTVTVSRSGNLVQSFIWEIELRHLGGRWQIWTVRTANSGHEPAG
ncbi:MAG: hypothetical protein Q8Q52_03605 [Acidimicrobiia bacterium]|nr:hypothetical protein [Acidimicrobiia bacterium]